MRKKPTRKSTVRGRRKATLYRIEAELEGKWASNRCAARRIKSELNLVRIAIKHAEGDREGWAK